MGSSAAPERVLAGRYRLISRLGSGGMGTVWLARDELLDRQVGVKEVRPPPGVTQAERAVLRERTLREARIVAQLRHPNVVAVHDIVEDGDRPWIVMELGPARSLQDVIQRAGPLTPRQAARIGLQVLAALSAAHAIGIMHRDVKPDNVLIDTDGRAMLADFGIARARDSPVLTASGVVLGSPSYIAPERARGERGGRASDLWSLGATLYCAVEGRPPYERPGALVTAIAVASEDPDPPRRAGPLWPVISGLLQQDPDQRLEAGAAEQMLRRVIEAGETPGTALITQPPRGRPSPVTKPLDRLRPARQTSPPPAREHPQPGALPRRRTWLVTALAAALVLVAGILIRPGTAGHAAGLPPGTGQATGAPRGFHRYADPTGFSIAVPDGWTVSRRGGEVDLRDRSGTRFLVIGQTGYPLPGQLARWRRQEARRLRTYRGYHRIRQAVVSYPPAVKAVDWEFTYDGRSGRIRVLNRDLLANSGHAYSLLWSTPASEWNSSRRFFQIFARTFRPAPASQPAPASRQSGSTTR